ncbi:MAG: hypothetical protein IJD92_01635 [Bacilli bacterium]|nr:hypothetical protein [Bacilli bacterium]
MKGEPWDGNIDTARESQYETPVENPYDGTREYSNGTYGQNDYTVREIGNGEYALYIKSDSEKTHDHWLIDENGDIIEKYHDFRIENSIFEDINTLSNQEFLIKANQYLETEKPKTLCKKLY